MMNRAEQNWPTEDVIDMSVPCNCEHCSAREQNESFVDWALRVIDNALNGAPAR